MKKIVILGFGLFLMAACGCNEQKAPDHDELIDSISAIEQTVSEQSLLFSADTAEMMVNMYTRFVDNFPEDSLTPIYMMRIADIEVNRGNFDKGIVLYDSVINTFLGFEGLPECMLRKAEALDQDGEHREQAIAAYQDFISQYPDDPRSQEIVGRLQYANMTQEELLATVHKMENQSRK